MRCEASREMNQTSLYKKYYKELFDSVPEYWDKIYSESTFFGYHYQRRRDVIAALISNLPPEDGRVVLDVGCGSGGYFPVYLASGMKVQGVDVSDGMVANAKEIYKKHIESGDVCVQSGDIENLAFDDETFDLAVSAGVFMYLPDMKNALAEMHRVLKKGGFAVLNVDNHRTLAAALDIPKILMNMGSKVFGITGGKLNANNKKVAEPSKSGEAPVTKSHTPSKLRSIVKQQGFEIVSEVGHGFGPLRLFGKRMLPDKGNLMLYKLTEPLFTNRLIGRTGFTYTVLAKKT